jgi:hypothetical protein
LDFGLPIKEFGNSGIRGSPNFGIRFEGFRDYGIQELRD